MPCQRKAHRSPVPGAFGHQSVVSLIVSTSPKRLDFGRSQPTWADLARATNAVSHALRGIWLSRATSPAQPTDQKVQGSNPCRRTTMKSPVSDGVFHCLTEGCVGHSEIGPRLWCGVSDRAMRRPPGHTCRWLPPARPGGSHLLPTVPTQSWGFPGMHRPLHGAMHRPLGRAQGRSKRSAFITLAQAATKSRTNFSLASS